MGPPPLKHPGHLPHLMVAPSSSLVARNIRVFVGAHVPARDPGCVAFEYSEGNELFHKYIWCFFFINVYNTITFSKSAFDFIKKKKKTIDIFGKFNLNFLKGTTVDHFTPFWKKIQALNVLNQIKQMPKHLEAVHRPPKHLHQTLSKLSTHTFNALGWDEPIKCFYWKI